MHLGKQGFKHQANFKSEAEDKNNAKALDND